MLFIPVDATCLLATVILMMAGATKNYFILSLHVCHQKAQQGRNIVQTEDEGKDL